MDSEEETKLNILKGLVEDANKQRRHPDQETTCGVSPLQNPQQLEELILKHEKKFYEFVEIFKTKSEYWFLLGKLYNCHAGYRGKALEALCKAVKLDNNRVEAWNELGECYWYNRNVEMARQCFERALDLAENKCSLRSLSIVIRKQGLLTDSDVRRDHLSRATSLAKRALALDPTDGLSWSILGNAYLAEYFSGSQDYQAAIQAVRAYKQAEKSLTPEDNYELYYNKGIALKYTEQYSEALVSLSLAAQFEGGWGEPSTCYEELLKYLDMIMAILGKRGKIKPKRYRGMVQALKTPSLGPFQQNKAYKPMPIQDLIEGVNNQKLLCGKVLWTIQLDSTFPFTLGLVDENGDEVVVTVFNLSIHKGFLVGDSLIIPDPYFCSVEVKHLDKAYAFKKVRVNYPPSLILNGKKSPLSYYARAKFDTNPHQ